MTTFALIYKKQRKRIIKTQTNNNTMKKQLSQILAILAIALVTISCNKERVEINQLKNMSDSLSYALGFSMGHNLGQEKVEINKKIFSKAFAQGYKNDTVGSMSLGELDEIMMYYFTSLESDKQEAHEAEMRMIAEQNLPMTIKFLETNKEEKDVVTTNTGLQYRVIAPGQGSPIGSRKPELNLDITLSNLKGEVFDNTFAEGREPLDIDYEILEMNFPFLSDILSQMKKGSHYEFWVSPELGGQMDGTLLIIELRINDIK